MWKSKLDNIGRVVHRMSYIAQRRIRFDQEPKVTVGKMIENYRQAAHAGILKVLSKMGISTLMSYKGAGMFQAVGVAQKVKESEQGVG